MAEKLDFGQARYFASASSDNFLDFFMWSLAAWVCKSQSKLLQSILINTSSIVLIFAVIYALDLFRVGMNFRPEWFYVD